MRSSLIGRVYGRLTVEEKAVGGNGRNSLYRCRCECGNIKITPSNHLASGSTKSCGCLHVDAAKNKDLKKRKHGLWNSKTYKSWMSMRSRCSDKGNASYKYYGAIGISVCERWLKFENFLEDMGERPEGMTLDRKDSKQNYEPSNCKWSTYKDQANNRTNNVFVDYEGEQITLAEFARRIGLSHAGATKRVKTKYNLLNGVFRKEGD